ncbi:hypothetical protein HJC23_005498 [Cyclotella cryptica]|uniref:Exonuclease domain-containing protein n=1 Tax=Cyclotella cryptica TaxID=29204 RepID=A0ABD3PGG9_9STRA
MPPAPAIPAKTNTKSRRNPKQPKNQRRKRRPATVHEPHDESSNATTCTLSTVPSDSSLDSSFDNHSLDYTHSPQRCNTRRRRSRKAVNTPNKTNNTKKSNNNKKSTNTNNTPKQVQITELTPEQKSHYIALDAEMVGIIDKYGRQHSALARITLVDWNGEPLFDSYVRVTQPIVDYRTFVSGITPQHLTEEHSALPLLEVRRIVGEMIHERVVVGHGLKNDFKALGLSHPWYLTRDSAKYLPFMKAPSHDASLHHPQEYTAKKLKTLALDKLGMRIQREGMAHDPVEDAVAAMELYKKHREKWERAVEWKMEKSREMEEMMNERGLEV